MRTFAAVKVFRLIRSKVRCSFTMGIFYAHTFTIQATAICVDRKLLRSTRNPLTSAIRQSLSCAITFIKMVKGMNDLVFVGRNDRVLTTSLKVAEIFGKEHSKVMRDITNLYCSDDFRAANFGGSSYTSEQNKQFPMYEMTKDGFTFLVMGYTGKKAAAFKEAYIKRFNEMEAELRKRTILPIYSWPAQRHTSTRESESTKSSSAPTAKVSTSAHFSASSSRCTQTWRYSNRN